ncbi:MAG TPA: hypothetical protein VHT03_05075 [Rhizomicrobium sp.]|jgi:hypothetical protein|nr:hypothetical protein [Rhizomicrobium sp.]
MSQTPLTQPQLGADFAKRVLEAADRHRARRRRFRALAATFVVALGIAAATFWRDLAVTAPGVGPGKDAVFAAGPRLQAAAEATDSTADPLSYMFPDAGPLARYASEDDADNDAVSDPFDDQQ